MKDTVRIGVIGLGNIGSLHAKYLNDGEIQGAELAAVCDASPRRIEWARANMKTGVKTFERPDELIASDSIDAVLVAVPHYDHPPLAIKAFQRGFHVMVEKPAGVYARQVRQMNEAAKKSGRVFGIMFNKRTSPIFRKLKDLLSAGELGAIKRVNYTMSEFYRCQAYYDSGEWRGTWAGEGGGLLLNQCPHSLDLWQMLCGVPVRVRAFCGYGKYRNIEVEDEVTAYVEYAGGATGLLISSVSETPGTNRLEIVGDMGKIVVEDEKKIVFWRNRQSEKDYNAASIAAFGRPEAWICEVPVADSQNETHPGHQKIAQNWVNAILKGEPLIVPGEEGINSVQISNAIHLSSWLDDRVEVPVDEDLFYEKLQEKIRGSTFAKKGAARKVETDIRKSFF